MNFAILTILVLLLMMAFFSGMEIAYVTSNKLKLEIDKKNSPGFIGKILERITSNPESFITTMLVGNNVVLVIYGIIAGELINRLLQQKIHLNTWQSALAETVISSLVILILAEFIPKIVFQLYANRFLKIFAIPTYIIYLILRPVSWTVIHLSNGLLKLINKDYASASETSISKSEIQKYLDRHAEEQDTAEEEPELRMFSNALEFGNVKVREIMVPRTEIVAVDVNTPIDEVRKIFNESGHSKIIAYKDNIDNIAGYIHFYDLFKQPGNLRQIIRKVIMVPETENIADLLKEMTRRKKSIAVVFEEYGGTAGIVTIEDILENLFGEIEDETDKENGTNKQLDDKTYLFSARKNIDEINDQYRLKIPESEDFESLGGYVLELFGRIPKPGESVEDERFRYTVTKASDKHIEEIKVEKKEKRD